MAGYVADPFLRLESFLKTDRIEGDVIDEGVRRHPRGEDWVGTIIVNPYTFKVSNKNIGLFLIIYVKCTIRFFNRPDTTFIR